MNENESMTVSDLLAWAYVERRYCLDRLEDPTEESLREYYSGKVSVYDDLISLIENGPERR